MINYSNRYPVGLVAINKDDKIRNASTSGGVFTVIAEWIINNNGAVAGAVFHEDFSVHHEIVEDVKSLEKLRGSKYVESDLGNTFPEIKKILNCGRYVLFTGMSCQVEGLYSYLQTDYPKLFTLDFICAGVPSNLVWQQYLKCYYEKPNIENITFKDKEFGWDNFHIRITEKESEHIEKGRTNLYMRGYLQKLYSRPYCYHCKFKGLKRKSDFTIGDAWGIKIFAPDLFDNKGASTIFIQNKKAEYLWKNIADCFVHRSVACKVLAKYNSSMLCSATLTKERNKFFKVFLKYGILRAYKIAFKQNIANKIINSVRRIHK